MAYIKSFSNPGMFSTGMECAPTAANFPAVKHFWQCGETSGTTLTDVINGVVLSGASSMTFGTNYVVPNRVANGSTKTGTVTPPNGKPFLFMAVGAFAGGGFQIGDIINGAGLSLAQGAAASVVDGIAEIYPGSAYTNGGSTVYGRGLFVSNYNSATGMQTLEATGTATYSAKAATTTADSTPSTTHALSVDNLASLEGGSGKWACPSTVTALYGAALFIFTSAPSAAFIQTLMVWHTYQWANGNKWIYPGLKGVT